MKKFLCTLFFSTTLFAKTYEHIPNHIDEVWEVAETEPFTELFLNWNVLRPQKNGYTFFVSLKQNGQWSPFFYYGQWGSWGQLLFKDFDPSTEVYRGIVRPRKGTCEGFRIRVEGEPKVATLSVFINTPSLPSEKSLAPILLPNPDQQSLITLRADRYLDLYLTTAVSTAINTLSQSKKVHPLEFAAQAYDQDYDAYDHWPLIAAQAYDALQGQYIVQIQRLPDFATLHSYLLQGTPVVVGIQGTLTGGPRPYYREHAICVIGYDPETQKVHCLDAMFPNDRATFVSYSLHDFLYSWKRRQNIACTFKLGKGEGEGLGK